MSWCRNSSVSESTSATMPANTQQLRMVSAIAHVWTKWSGQKGRGQAGIIATDFLHDSLWLAPLIPKPSFSSQPELMRKVQQHIVEKNLPLSACLLAAECLVHSLYQICSSHRFPWTLPPILFSHRLHLHMASIATL